MKRWLSFSALLALGCGFGSPTVVRVVDGEQIRGPFIDSVTYALYARGSYHEHRGELDPAAQAYKAASERDPDSPAIWTRLGSVLCASRRGGYERAFELARRADAEFAPLWREQARCALARGDARAAVEAAERAVRFEPRDEENTLTLARALEKVGRSDDALRWLAGLTTARPSAVSGWKLLSEIAGRAGEKTITLRAERRLRELAARTRSVPRRVALGEQLDGLDAALSAGNIERARRIAIEIGVSADDLALRAAALGLPRLAAEQAELVLGADPSNADAWVAALVAADLVGDAARFHAALGALTEGARRPDAFGARLMADLLERRVSAQASRAWLNAYGPLPEPADALEQRVAARLGPS